MSIQPATAPELAAGPTVEQLRKNIRHLFKLLHIDPTPCDKCGRAMWFVTMPSGKRNPFTDDALSHYADCPHAASFRKA